MPPKTDADPAFNKEEILALFKKSKQGNKSYTFAFGLASKPKECGFVGHLRKPGKTLKGQLKSSSPAIKKACFGTFELVGNDVMLTCARPIKGIVRQLTVRFREEKMVKFKPILLDKDGNVVDEETLPDAEEFDDSDEADDIADTIDAPADAADREEGPANALANRLADVRSDLDAGSQDRADRLKSAFVAAVKELQDRDFDKAEASIKGLEDALAAPDGDNETASTERALRLLIERVKDLSDTEMAAAMPLIKAIKSAHDKGQTAAADKAIDALNARIDTGTVVAQPAASSNEAPSSKSLLTLWNTAKEDTDTKIEKMANAMRKFDQPALTRIADHGLTALNGGSAYVKLVAALLEFDKANDATKASAAHNLTTAAKAYSDALKADKMVAHWEDNPFVGPLQIVGPLGKVLDEIVNETETYQ